MEKETKTLNHENEMLEKKTKEIEDEKRKLRAEVEAAKQTLQHEKEKREAYNVEISKQEKIYQHKIGNLQGQIASINDENAQLISQINEADKKKQMLEKELNAEKVSEFFQSVIRSIVVMNLKERFPKLKKKSIIYKKLI